MDNLKEVVRAVIFRYAEGGGVNHRTYAFGDDERAAYAVNVIDFPVVQYPAAVVVMAHVEEDRVFIDADITDRPLVDALVQAGIPREKIVLTYAGETVPEN